MSDALADKSFDQRRWRQRHLLREIPDWMVASACDPHSPFLQPRKPLDGPDVVLMELHLRDLADATTGELGEATLTELRSVAIAGAAARLYVSWGRRGLDALEEANKTVLASIAETTYVQHSGRYLDGMTKEEDGFDGAPIAALITALVWADELAGDYTDPRVPKGFLAVSPER